jgi:hypothetical protein
LSLTLRDNRRLSVFENRVLRKTYGPRREEQEDYIILHNKELQDLYSSPNIILVIQ